MSTTRNRCERRSALTLIELLIVMGLLIILASISLGAMKTLLRGQKVSQASVTVRQYLQNAQTRAIASGRPVAVFFDRVSMMAGDTTGSPTSANFTSTRLQLGEVFPPYTGDFENAQGRLLYYSEAPNAIQSVAQVADPTHFSATGYANCLFFDNNITSVSNIAQVISGFGSLAGTNHLPGFVDPGDNLEIDGCEVRFQIAAYRVVPASAAFPSGGLGVVFRNMSLEFPVNKVGVQIPLAGNEMLRKFRAYRQPTKSLASSVVLPRGTCVDLSVSGVGLNNSGVEDIALLGLGDEGNFGLKRAPVFVDGPPPNPVNPGSFSRVAILFSASGRVAFLIREDSINGTLHRSFLDGSSMIYLMVGRTDQVLPGFPANPGNLPESARRAALQHPNFGASDLPKSNLVDPENVWVTCNPITGEVKTSPVVAIEDADIAARYNLPAVPITDLINQTRSLAAAGISN